ncbi:MAG TPA: MerR family DNA-binding transcriptional regulator [Candidatus Paceibacterota bacterium]|jgi:DNA-binding transcriptional MerR regulator|nr:MerR family DNA-binding transcriptional regulator [Candidatus Paceibacterota bacterium]HOH11359.1 MerR family DNA-binding transcriptional regulator [Candidatus Paceibacterota bacterium]HOY11359.1 MerR family DNA-binding transcriptional regulator [Candidatus Paceibacterota bacterium]HPB60407.1 MerR family DNA-binding transcriptional regulator [Candidatus Paceibacterota bacterium]HPI24451.1 MerR family DNA-binding transcriptional regulator [Candidatus Paceibacterota bacterium]
MEKGLVTIKSAAEILGVSVETLRNWDRRGVLKAKRSPQNGYRLYNISELQKMLKQKQIKEPRVKRAKLAD